MLVQLAMSRIFATYYTIDKHTYPYHLHNGGVDIFLYGVIVNVITRLMLCSILQY